MCGANRRCPTIFWNLSLCANTLVSYVFASCLISVLSLLRHVEEVKVDYSCQFITPCFVIRFSLNPMSLFLPCSSHTGEDLRLHKTNWTKDSNSPMCQLCCENFNIRVRRHHCRSCGVLCCDDCSSKVRIFFTPFFFYLFFGISDCCRKWRVRI